MTATAAARPAPPTGPWVCPFCPLLCEHLGVALAIAPSADPSADPSTNPFTNPPAGQFTIPSAALSAAPSAAPSTDAPPRLLGADCARATQRLGRLLALPADAGATVNGQPATLDAALQAAANILQASRQPLLGGLGTDVAGARALYRLSEATGAISDSAAGQALTEAQRALQDSGGFTTTLAELRTRADLVLCIGGVFADAAPLFFERCVLPPRHADIEVGPAARSAPAPGPRQVVVLGAADPASPADQADQALLARLVNAPGVALQVLPLHGDLHQTLALLAALVAQREILHPPPALVALAQALRGARYSVIVGAPAALPRHGALVVEAVHRIVERLNLHTRAAALWLGGGEGEATVNQVFTWLSGLPLRSRRSPLGLDHQPLAFDAARLLAAGAVDALLWVSCFDADLLPPPAACPRIVFGPPALGRALRAQPRPAASAGHDTVFIPVATPGIHSAGDLFRTDGAVLLPLRPVPGLGLTGLPPLAGLLDGLLGRLRQSANPARNPAHTPAQSPAQIAAQTPARNPAQTPAQAPAGPR